MCVIDSMHNLFLGTAKRVFTKWIESEILTKAGLETIQTRINEMPSLSDIGRRPGNIKSSYGGYTAAQWKYFVLQYSMYCLKDAISDQHLRYWQSFARACHLLCKPCITKEDLIVADCKLLHFVKIMRKLMANYQFLPTCICTFTWKSSLKTTAVFMDFSCLALNDKVVFWVPITQTTRE